MAFPRRCRTYLGLGLLCLGNLLGAQNREADGVLPPHQDREERETWEAFVRAVATGTLARDYPGALRHLESGEARQKITGLKVLGVSGELEAIPHLVSHLEATDPAIRTCAAHNLERLVSGIELRRRDPSRPETVKLLPRRPGDPDLRPLRWVVRRMLRAPEDAGVQGYAATMAASIELADLEPELRHLLKSRHPATVNGAQHALRTLGLQVQEEGAPFPPQVYPPGDPPPLPTPGAPEAAAPEREAVRLYAAFRGDPEHLETFLDAIVEGFRLGVRGSPLSVPGLTDPRWAGLWVGYVQGRELRSGMADRGPR